MSKGGIAVPSFTKKAIKASFLKLLNERPLSQITVKDIVEDCGVNRNSFYYHFADIPSLLDEIVKERADEIIAQHASVSTLEECMTATLEFAMQNKRAVLHAYRSTSREAVETYLLHICQYLVESYAQTTVGELPILPEDRQLLIRFFQCECFGQAILWLNSGMSYDMEAQFTRLGQLMHGMMEELVRRCVEDAKE